MPASKIRTTVQRKFYFNKRRYRKYKKAKFLRAVSNYQYLKVQVPLYIMPYVPDPAGVMQLSGYRIGTSLEYLNYGSSSDHMKFPSLLYNSNEFNQFKGQFSVYRIRGLLINIEKFYDPRYNVNKDNEIKHTISLAINMNRAVSQNELNFGSCIEITQSDEKISKYFFNRIKSWYRTDFSISDSATWGDDNNGEIYVTNNDTLDLPLTSLPNFPRYKINMTFYVLFKDNKYN